MKSYRPLTDKEIATLVMYGCSAEDWKKVTVAENFSPQFVSNVSFSGTVKLGSFEKVFELDGGFKKHSGIYNACIHNCIIGNDVYIDKIHNYIANYEIGDETYIENTNIILVEGKSGFGNGLRISVMNETGGREIPIFNELSAPLAYVLASYRHKPQMISNLLKMIDAYAESKSSTMGKIGCNVKVINCGRIKNV